MMLATRSPSRRCTSQPARMATAARGNLTSQYQQRPLPVVAMARSAALTSNAGRSGVLSVSALKFSSDLCANLQ